MSKPWRPRHTRWLGPAAYDALSPAEKRQLWRERNAARIAGTGSRPRRGARRRAVSQNWIWAVIVALTFVAVYRSDLPAWRPLALGGGATAEGGERVTFGACKWGGGTNCVVDGDTLYLHGAKIRIAGIDAPETHDYACPAELERGERAAARLQALVNGGAITLTSIDRDEDVYGRKLRNVAVNGRDVGDALVAEGLARPYRGYKMGWCSSS